MTILNVDVEKESQYACFEIQLPDGEGTTVTVWEDGDVVFEREDYEGNSSFTILVHNELLKEITQITEKFAFLRDNK